MPDTSTDAAGSPLLPQVARGERTAMQRCIQRYGALVWSMALRWSPSRGDAEDATQEIFLDLWRHAGRFDPLKGSEKVFIAVIARRRLIDRLRTLRARLEREVETLDAAADIASADPPTEQVSELAIARAALAQLPQEQRRVLDLSVVQGLTHSEIAERLELPVGTVKTWIRRGLIKVRHALNLESDASGDRP